VARSGCLIRRECTRRGARDRPRLGDLDGNAPRLAQPRQPPAWSATGGHTSPLGAYAGARLVGKGAAPGSTAVSCASVRKRTSSGSPVSSHSRQIQSPPRSSRALSAAGTIVTPQVAQIGGRRASSTPEVWSGERGSGGRSMPPAAPLAARARRALAAARACVRSARWLKLAAGAGSRRRGCAGSYVRGDPRFSALLRERSLFLGSAQRRQRSESWLACGRHRHGVWRGGARDVPVAPRAHLGRGGR